MLEKKSMVLTSASGGQEKAVLSMECDKNMLTGRVRLYNFGAEPKGIISLGIFDQNKVVKAGLTKVSSMLFSFQTESASMPQNFSCAVVNLWAERQAQFFMASVTAVVTENKFLTQSFLPFKE